MRKVELPDQKIGYFHHIDSHDDFVIELEDGSICSFDQNYIKFIDKPEYEQLAEFAKAAMQGLCSSFVNDEADRDEYNYAAMSVMIAKATIEELKKQKK
jgi:hypothetical protein